MSLETQLVTLLERVGADIGFLMADRQDEMSMLRRLYGDVDLAYAYRHPDEEPEGGLE